MTFRGRCRETSHISTLAETLICARDAIIYLLDLERFKERKKGHFPRRRDRSPASSKYALFKPMSWHYLQGPNLFIPDQRAIKINVKKPFPSGTFSRYPATRSCTRNRVSGTCWTRREAARAAHSVSGGIPESVRLRGRLAEQVNAATWRARSALGSSPTEADEWMIFSPRSISGQAGDAPAWQTPPRGCSLLN